MKKAIEQMKRTIIVAQKNKMNVKYALFVYSGKAGRSGQLYKARKNDLSPTGRMLWNIRKTRGSPVQIGEIKVWAIKEDDLEKYNTKIKNNLESYQ